MPPQKHTIELSKTGVTKMYDTIIYTACTAILAALGFLIWAGAIVL